MKLLASLVLGQLLGALVHASLDEAGPRQHVAALLLRRQSSSEAPRALTAEAEISPRGSLAKRENPSFRRLLHLLKTGALGYFVAGQGPGGHLAKVHDFLARRGSELQPATQRRLEHLAPQYPQEAHLAVVAAEKELRSHGHRPGMDLDRIVRIVLHELPLRDFTAEEKRQIESGRLPGKLPTAGRHQEHMAEFERQQAQRRRREGSTTSGEL